MSRANKSQAAHDEWKYLYDLGFCVTEDWVSAYCDAFREGHTGRAATSATIRNALINELLLSDFRKLPITPYMLRSEDARNVLPCVPLQSSNPISRPIQTSGTIEGPIVLQVIKAVNLATQPENASGRLRKHIKRDVSTMSSYTDAMTLGSTRSSSSDNGDGGDEDSLEGDNEDGISTSATNRYKRVLRFALTDGVTEFAAIEQEPLKGLSLVKPETKREQHDFPPPIKMVRDHERPQTAYIADGVWGDAVLTGGYKLVLRTCKVQNGVILLNSSCARVLGGVIMSSPKSSMKPGSSLAINSVASTAVKSPQSTTTASSPVRSTMSSSSAASRSSVSSTSPNLFTSRAETTTRTSNVYTHQDMEAKTKPSQGSSESDFGLAGIDLSIYDMIALDEDEENGSTKKIEPSPISQEFQAPLSSQHTLTPDITRTQSGARARTLYERIASRSGSQTATSSSRSSANSGATSSDDSSTYASSQESTGLRTQLQDVSPSLHTTRSRAPLESSGKPTDITNNIPQRVGMSTPPTSSLSPCSIPDDEVFDPSRGLFAIAEIVIAHRVTALAIQLRSNGENFAFDSAGQMTTGPTWNDIKAAYRTTQQDLYMRHANDPETGAPLASLPNTKLFARLEELERKFERAASRTGLVDIQPLCGSCHDNKFWTAVLACETVLTDESPYRYAISPLQLSSDLIQTTLGCNADAYLSEIQRENAPIREKSRQWSQQLKNFQGTLPLSNFSLSEFVSRHEPVVALTEDQLKTSRWINRSDSPPLAPTIAGDATEAKAASDAPFIILCGPLTNLRSDRHIFRGTPQYEECILPILNQSKLPVATRMDPL